MQLESQKSVVEHFKMHTTPPQHTQNHLCNVWNFPGFVKILPWKQQSLFMERAQENKCFIP